MPVTASVNASNSSIPSYSYVAPNVYGGGDGVWVEFHINNPSSNSYAVTTITVTAGTGWTLEYCDYVSSPLYEVSYDSSGNSCTWSSLTEEGDPGLTPGASAWLEMYVLFPTTSGSQTYPLTGVFTTEVQDASSLAFYRGASITLYSVSTSTDLTAVPTSTTYTAGGAAFSVQAVLNEAYNALPITWVAEDYGTFAGSSTANTYPTASTSTNSTGGAHDAFSPSNLVADSPTSACAYLGNPWSSPTELYTWWSAACDMVTTVPGAPSTVTFTYDSFNLNSTEPYYVTDFNTPPNSAHTNLVAETTEPNLVVSAADKYGNAISYGSLTGLAITITATSGKGVFDDAGTNETSVSCTDSAVNCANGDIAVDYYQGGTYGTVGILLASISGTVTSDSKAFAVSARSGSIITSTFTTTDSVAPTVSGTMIQAGDAVKVIYTLQNDPQTGVPVAFYAINDTLPLVDYIGSFTTNNVVDTTSDAGVIFANTTANTNSSSIVQTLFSVDTNATNREVEFTQCIIQPVGSSPKPIDYNYWCSGDDSDVVHTIPGAPVKFQIVEEYGLPKYSSPAGEPYLPGGYGVLTNPGYAVAGGNLSVDVKIVDAYGNVAVNPGYQIQMALSTSCGATCPLTSTSVYIGSGVSDTATQPGSFGPINWFMPSAPTSDITISTTGVVDGHTTTDTATVNVVSATPVVAGSCSNCAATVDGIAYSGSGALTLEVKANSSLGYGGLVPIDSVGYKVDTGSWQTVDTKTLDTAYVTEPITTALTNGEHTLTYNATDDLKNVSPDGSFHVVVDTTSPTITFVTPNNATLSAGSTVSATIVDSEGDLNMSSGGVTAVANGTTTLPVAIGASDNPGNSVTYPITISGLTAGTWSIVLSASNYAGNSGSATIKVHVEVPPDETFTGPAPSLVTVNGLTYVNATFTNNDPPTSLTAQVWFELKNTAGQVVFLTADQQSVASGHSVSILFGIPLGLPAGAYTAETFVYVSGQAYSPLESLSVTAS